MGPTLAFFDNSVRCFWLSREASSAASFSQIVFPRFSRPRSPYSAVFYAANGHLLEQVIRHQVVELESQANIKVITVSLKVKEDLLWDRISKRLQREPERKKYREDQWDWMQQVRLFYDVASSVQLACFHCC